MASVAHVRHGFETVRPYLDGAYELPEFLATVFGAREIERHEAPDRRAAHVEMALGDGALVVEAGEMPPEDKPYVERGCGFRAFGNIWWVATYLG